VIVDEAGPLELRDKGWSNRIRELLPETGKILIITVRNNLVDDVTAKFGITDPQIIDVGSYNPATLAEEIAAGQAGRTRTP